MKIKITDFIKNLTFISILLGCFGILITNNHLNSYNFPVFETINSRVIYVGFVFGMFIIAHILVYAMFINFKEIHNNSFLFIIITTALKVVVITNIIIIIFHITELNYLTVKFSPFWSKLFYIGIALSTSVVSILSIGYVYIKKDKDSFSLLFKIILALGVISNLLIFYYIYRNFTPAKEIFNFEFYFGFLFLCAIVSVVANSKDIKKGIKLHSDTFFSSDTESRNIFDKIFFYFFLIIVILILTRNYSDNIYKNIDKDNGGGKIETITLVTKVDTITGNLVLQSSEYFLIEKDSSLIRVNWGDVNKIISNK